MKKLLFIIPILLSILSYSQTLVIGKDGWTTKSPADSTPVFEGSKGKGVWYSFSDTAALHRFPPQRMDNFQVAYVGSNDSLYLLIDSVWTPQFRFQDVGNGGGGGTLTNITATSNYSQTWNITGTTVKNLSLVLDTFALSTRAYRRKGTDSLGGIISLKLNISDTSNRWMTSIYKKPGTDSVFSVKGGISTFVYIDNTGSSITSGNAASVADIPALISFVRDTITTVFVLDSTRGGVFHHRSTGSNDYGINFTANGGGYWQRDMSQSQSLNLKWFGARGLGISSLAEDTAGLHNIVKYSRSINNRIPIYVPEALDANGRHSFYAFAGNAMYVGDNFNMFGDGKNKSEIKNVSPLSTTDQYKGAVFYLGTYGPDTASNPLQAKVHKYSTYPAAINDSFLILQDITKASEMFVGEVIAYGCFKTNKGNDPAKFRMAYWERNEISRINADTLFFKWLMRIPMLNDGLGVPPQIQNINNLAGIANNTGLPNGTCKNVNIRDMMLTQSQFDELADTAITRQVGVIYQPGNGFNCNFENLTITGYMGIGGNMWTHTTWRNVLVISEGKLIDFGYASSDCHIEDVEDDFRPSPASNFATAAILMNDDTHDMWFRNVKLHGDFNGTQVISSAGGQGITMEDMNVDFPNYYNDNNIIQIGGDSLRSSINVTIKDGYFRVGAAGEFLRIVQNEPSSVQEKNINISNLVFKGGLVGYDSSGVFTFTYTTSGETPRRGDTYTTNGSTYTVRDNRATEISGGVFKETFVRTAGTNNPLTSGTLTKSFGGGATTLSFSAFVIESVSAPYALHIEEQRGVKLYNVSFDTGKLYAKRDTACTLLQVRSTDSLLVTNSLNLILGVTVPGTNYYDNGNALSIFNKVPYVNGMPAPIKYTPLNSTDATYPNGTLSADNTYFYFRKSNGTWVKIAWSVF